MPIIKPPYNGPMGSRIMSNISAPISSATINKHLTKPETHRILPDDTTEYDNLPDVLISATFNYNIIVENIDGIEDGVYIRDENGIIKKI